VEDEALIRLDLKEMLEEEEGYEVVAAGSSRRPRRTAGSASLRWPGGSSKGIWGPVTEASAGWPKGKCYGFDIFGSAH
jgi:hypothetical protein